MKRRAFTLVEMLVVLAVIAIISTLTFGVIRNTIESNKKSSCVSNMIQVYGALRLYAQDYDGLMPYFKPNTNVVNNTIKPLSDDNAVSGLWLLVRYPNGTRSGYLRSSEKFVCPSDRFHVPGTDMPTDSPLYNSYQVIDDTPDGNQYTYTTFRKANTKRQLAYYNGTTVNDSRRVADTTVITWCRYHRGLADDGTTKSLGDASNRDNVLFFDGRVQPLPIEQDVSNGSGTNGTCKGWQRVPLQLQDSLSDVPNCEFAN